MLNREAIPEAVAESLNMVAHEVTRQSLRNINRRLIVRTKYTTNSLTNKRARPYYAQNKAMGRKIGRMFSRSGSFNSYLEAQEYGGTTKGVNGGPLPIPHKNIRKGKDAMKAIATRYRLDPDEKLRPGHVGSMTGDRYFIGRPKGGKFDTYGLYERGYNNKRLKFHRNLEYEEAKIPAVHWHRDAVKRYGDAKNIRQEFNKSASKRLSKFRGRR
jgi:hypothetical protein